MPLTSEQRQRISDAIICLTTRCASRAPKAQSLRFKMLSQELAGMTSPARTVSQEQYASVMARAEAAAAEVGEIF